MRPSFPGIRSRLTALVVCALLIRPASGQSPAATITGTITDSQAASIPGVKVTARHLDTGLRYSATSTADGTYVLSNLPVGAFEVIAESPGFKTTRQENVLLEVGQRLRLDLTLQIGEVQESITVSAEVSRIQTEDSSLSTVVERQRVEELPLNGRNVFALTTLVAGVMPTSKDVDGFADQTISFRVNGGPNGGSQVLLDGGVNSTSAKGLAVVPMADSVEEFRLETNALKAEYGHTSGGVISVATKAGTNNLHGSLYEFFRNDALDARNAFATQPDASGRVKPILRYNQFGGTAGGPVWLPKVYNGRNRTFFFGGYEQWRYTNASLMRGTLPTAAEREGDFTKTRDGRGQRITIYDPATTRPNPVGKGFVRDPFPGNVIPAGRFDPVSVNIMKIVPLPNVAADNPYTNANNWLYLGTSPLNQATGNIRIDHRLSDKDAFLFRYSRTRQDRHGTGYGFGVADPNTMARSDQRDRHNWTLSNVHILSPRVTNDFRANASRFWLRFRHPSAGQGWPQKLGMAPNVPPDLFPSLSITGVTALGPTSIALGLQAEHTVQLVDAVAIVHGRHLLKAGIDQRWNRSNFLRTRYPSGQYQFNTTLTNNPQATAGTGYGMATFLLGEVTGGELRIQPAFSFDSWLMGTYFQDDFKVTPRLTLNLGLRYDVAGPPIERWNRHSNFDAFRMNPETGMLGRLVYAGVDTPSSFVDPDRNNFGPRFGFAYAVNPRTVVRGGFGVLYAIADSGDVSADKSNALGFEAVTSFAPAVSNYKAFQFRDGPPAILKPQGAAGGPSAFRGQTVRYQDRNSPTPYVEQWNFTVQRQLHGRWLASVSYAGNRGVKLFGANYDLNQLDPVHFSLGLALQEAVPNPFAGQIAAGALATANTTRSQLLKPYPDYVTVAMFANHGAASAYHSLQVTVEKRYSNGLSALISYTNGKLINDSASNAGAQADTLDDFRLGRFNRRLDRSLDETDVSQRLVLSGVYELPFGKRPRSIWSKLAGGWQVNSVTALQTGFPLAVRGASNNTGIPFPDYIHKATLPASERSAMRWFDPDAFRNPADFTIGNAPRTLPSTRGPGLVSLNGSLFRNFRLGEGRKLEFRLEAFNALNRVNLNEPNQNFTSNAQGMNNNPNLGRITSALPARRLQLGLRIAF